MVESQGHKAISVQHKLLLALLSLTGTAIILYATSRYGVGTSPDSVAYIASARHLADGTGFITYKDSPLLVQPPLYPVILAVSDYIFGVDPLVSASFINALFFGLNLYISGLLFHRNISPLLALIGTLALLVSVPLISVSLMAWSEPPFIFLVTLSIFALSMYWDRRDIQSLSLLSLAMALACLTRYIGVVFVLTSFVSILNIQHTNLKTRLLHAFTFLSVSVLPVSIWLGRNYILSKTLFGPRSPSLFSFSDNIRFTFDTILNWYLPGRITNSRLLLMLSGLIIGFLLGVMFAWVKPTISTLLRQRSPLVIPIFLFIPGYIIFLIISSSITEYDSIGDRLLSPIAVPITLLLLTVIESLYKQLKEHFPTKPVESFLMVGSILLLAYPARATIPKLIEQFDEGEGYNGIVWKNSQTIQYIREHNLSNCTIYSNGDDVIYLLLDVHVKFIPSKRSGANIIADASSLRSKFPQEDKACLIWFNRLSWREYLFTPDELVSVTNVGEVINLDDGAIYVVSRK